MSKSKQKQIETMTYESLVNECKRLRTVHERAEVQLFLFLVKVESEYRDVWMNAGCDSFDQFLRSNHLPKPDRYKLFAHGLARCGVDDALAHDVGWVMMVGMRPIDNTTLESLRERATAFREVEKTAPSEETSKMWRAELEPRSKPPEVISRATELMRLREENKKLRADLAAAYVRIVDLERKGNAA